MAETNDLLNDIVHFFAPLHPMMPPKTVLDGYIIALRDSNFRLAYSESTNTVFLFRSRNLEDLEAAPGPDGRLEIAHKERPVLVGARKLHHGVTRDTRGRLKLDIASWASEEIARADARLWRALLREANLHRTEDAYSSAFFSYRLIRRKHDRPLVKIITKKDNNYAFAGGENRDGDPLGKRFRAAADWVSEQAHPELPLRYSHGGETYTVAAVNSIDDAWPAIEGDYPGRFKDIWDGLPPINWKKNRRVAALHQLSAATRHLMSEGEHMAHDGHFAVDRAIDIADAAIDIPRFLLARAAHAALKYGEKEELPVVPPEWRHLVSGHTKPKDLDSVMHRHIVKPDPGAFGDIEWLNPEKHDCSVIAKPEELIAPDPARTFQQWLRSNLLAPYASTITYLGAGNAPVVPKAENFGKIRAVRINTSMGIALYWIPEAQKAYAYYHAPNYSVTDRRLPFDADRYFQQDKALVLDLRQAGAPMAAVRLETLQNVILRRRLEDPDIMLPSSDRPRKEVMNAPPLTPDTPDTPGTPAAMAPAPFGAPT